MKTYLFLLLFVFQAFSLSSQISLKGYNQEKIDPSLFEGRWKARWWCSSPSWTAHAAEG